MQAENRHPLASGDATMGARVGKRSTAAPRGNYTSPIGDNSPPFDQSTVQSSAPLEGLDAPLQALTHAHRPLRFLFEQAAVMLSPFAQILGLEATRLSSVSAKPSQEVDHARAK